MLNEKAKLVLAKTLGVDDRVDEIINSPEGDLSVAFSKAETIYRSKLKKSYIESALLYTDDVETVSKLLEIPEDIVGVYLEFFYDVKGWDRLSKIDHVDKVKKEGRDWTTNEALMKMWTLTQGLDFLAWRLGKKVSISPVEGLVDLFSTCMFKSKEAMFNPSVSDTSKESAKWVKLSTDIARLLKLWVMDSSAAKRDLEIAIREVVPEFGSLEDIVNSDYEQNFIEDMKSLSELNKDSEDPEQV